MQVKTEDGITQVNLSQASLLEKLLSPLISHQLQFMIAHQLKERPDEIVERAHDKVLGK